MNDNELYSACKSHGVEYSDDEVFVLKNIFATATFSTVLKYRLFISGSIALRALNPIAEKWLLDTGLFEKNSSVLFFKKYSLYAILEALDWSDDTYRFAACLYMTFLGIPSERNIRLVLHGEDFIEDLRLTLMQVSSKALPYGVYGIVKSINMNKNQKRFIALWLLFGVNEYHGIPIGQFLSCFGAFLFADIKIEKTSLTSDKISEILEADLAGDSSENAIRWVEENIK